VSEAQFFTKRADFALLCFALFASSSVKIWPDFRDPPKCITKRDYTKSGTQFVGMSLRHSVARGASLPIVTNSFFVSYLGIRKTIFRSGV